MSPQAQAPATFGASRLLPIRSFPTPSVRRCALLRSRAPLQLSAAVFHVGPFRFPTKKAARERTQKILYRKPIGRTTSKEDGEDFQFLCHLLQCHPKAQEKLAGSDISHFSTVREQVPGTFQVTTHFVLHRTDGTSEDFGYKKCMDSRMDYTNASSISSADTDDNSQQQQLLPDMYYHKPLRNAITPQIMQFREDAFAAGDCLTCPLTSVVLTKSNSDVDHQAPKTFVQLVNAWLQQEGLVLCQVESSVDMACPQQKRSWQDFHAQHAVLRMLSSRANRSSRLTPRTGSSSSRIKDSSSSSSSKDSGSSRSKDSSSSRSRSNDSSSSSSSKDSSSRNSRRRISGGECSSGSDSSSSDDDRASGSSSSSTGSRRRPRTR